MELIAIMAITLLLVPLVFLTTGVLRIVLGIICLLFFPGYALLALLFPRKDSMTGQERVALSFVASFAIVLILVLILNFTPWGIRLESVFITIVCFNLAAALSALYRRRRLLSFERFEISLHITILKWRDRSLLDKALSVLVLLAVLGAIGTLGYVISSHEIEESYTDFYILGSEGMANDYPREVLLGEPVEVILGIANHEHQNTEYNVEVLIDGEKVQETGSISLAHEESSQRTVTLIPQKVGEDQKVEFRLYRGEDNEPYLILYLWLDVKEA
jgi:uncharacterized membrane protein